MIRIYIDISEVEGVSEKSTKVHLTNPDEAIEFIKRYFEGKLKYDPAQGEETNRTVDDVFGVGDPKIGQE